MSKPRDEKETAPEVPSNCLSIPCRDGLEVEFEAEATKVDGKYQVWASLFDEGKLVSSCSAIVASLDQFTLKGFAVGYAEGWDVGPNWSDQVSPAATEFLAIEFFRDARSDRGGSVADLEGVWASMSGDQQQPYLDRAAAVVSGMGVRT